MTRSRLVVLILIFLAASIGILGNDILRELPPSREARDFLASVEEAFADGRAAAPVADLAQFPWDEVCLSRSALGLKHELFGARQSGAGDKNFDRYAVALVFYQSGGIVRVFGFPRWQTLSVDSARIPFAASGSDSGGSQCADRMRAKFSKFKARGRETISFAGEEIK